MEQKPIEQCEKAARRIQKHGGFTVCRLEASDLYVKPLPENAFAIVCACRYGTEPSETKSWEALEGCGVSLHADRDEKGAPFYTGVATWDTFVHMAMHMKGLERKGIVHPLTDDAAEKLWKQTESIFK